MKVLIDGHMIGSNEGGNERYTKNLFISLSKLVNKDFEAKLLVDRKYFGKSGIVKEKNIIVENIRSNAYRLLFLIPGIVKNWNIDAVHSNYIAPFYKNAKFVITVHDLSFKYFPQYFSFRERLIFKCLLPYSLKLADAIVVPSNFSKKELLKFYPQYREKLYVVYEAADEVFYPIHKNLAEKTIKKKFNLKPGYLLAINGKSPRKNINTIIEAYIKSQKIFPALKLIIVGGDFNIEKKYLNLEGITILGNVRDNQLSALYNMASIFIYYSAYEGFGLPILEALKCGVPVICSDIEIHREIARESVVYTDPYNENDLSKKIELLLTDNTLSKKLIRSGKKLNKIYTWDKTAKETKNVYDKVLRQR